MQQTWINIELAISIRNSIQQMTDQDSDNSLQFVRRGRLCIVIFCALFALATTVVLTTVQLTQDEDYIEEFMGEATSWFVTSIFSVDFTLLTASLIAVFYYLSVQEKIANDIHAFKREKCTLIALLLIFDCSYVIRALFNQLWSRAEEISDRGLYRFVIVPSFCDLIPVCCVLFFHTRNFKVIRAESLRTYSRTDEN